MRIRLNRTNPLASAALLEVVGIAFAPRDK